MNVKIQSLHFTINDGLNDFAIEKVEKLSHFYDRIEAANICLKLEKSDITANKVCEIRLAVPGNDLFATSQCTTFEEAVNETIEALQKQIRKLKTKFEKRHSA